MSKFPDFPNFLQPEGSPEDIKTEYQRLLKEWIDFTTKIKPEKEEKLKARGLQWLLTAFGNAHINRLLVFEYLLDHASYPLQMEKLIEIGQRSFEQDAVLLGELIIRFMDQNKQQNKKDEVDELNKMFGGFDGNSNTHQ